jgi:hypothetical protein
MAAALHTHLSKAKASPEGKGQETMGKRMTLMIVAALLTVPPFASAADKCPTELTEAKAMLSKASASTKKSATASGQDAQAPRQLAGAKSQDVQVSWLRGAASSRHSGAQSPGRPGAAGSRHPGAAQSGGADVPRDQGSEADR